MYKRQLLKNLINLNRGNLVALIIDHQLRKESKEESGFDHFILVDESIFDLDIHEIPPISKDPKHFHYDVRFLLEADPKKNNIIVSEESHDVQWIPLNEVLDMNPESSMQRMVNKTYGLAR